ncbi:hypothetical protein Aduo_011673 [Ancylostoma duodenale]
MSFVPPPPKRRRAIRIRANRTGELPRVPPVPGPGDHVVAGNVADSPVRRAPVAEASDALCTLSAERFSKYEYRKMYYCIQCDQSTPSAVASCRNEECAMKGVNPTRSKNLRKTSIHFVKIKPQLEIVLKRNLKTLSEVHQNIHTGVVNALRPNTSDFDDYRNDIESRGQPEMEKSSEELKENPTEFWLGLGPDNASRSSALQYRRDCRVRWTHECGAAIARAL